MRYLVGTSSRQLCIRVRRETRASVGHMKIVGIQGKSGTLGTFTDLQEDSQEVDKMQVGEEKGTKTEKE